MTIEGDRDSGNLLGQFSVIVGSNIGGEDDETTPEVGAVVGTAVGSVVGQNVGESLSRKAGVEIIISWIPMKENIHCSRNARRC